MRNPKPTPTPIIMNDMLRDPTRHASDSAHRAIGRSSQLIEDGLQAHCLALMVIADLIETASATLADEDGPGSTPAKIALTLQNIALILEQRREDG
jgi:hypothetical protein